MSRTRQRAHKKAPSVKKVQAPPTPPPVKPEPVASAVSSSGWRARVDEVLPPFTARRYVAIWLLGMIPLIAVLLLLLHPWDRTQPSPGAATPGRAATATTRGTATSPAAARSGASQGALSGSGQAVIEAGGAGGAGAAAPAATAKGKYLVLETSRGRIVAKLNTDPPANVGKTIAGLESKAAAGALNGQVFNRVEDWMVQGGNANDTGRLPAEYNSIPFRAGSVGVVHGVDATQNSDSQIIILKADAPFMDGQYTNLGQVVEGMNVVSQLAVGDKMLKVTVETR